MRALEIYATHEGHTNCIARRIAKGMAEAGLPTDTYNVGSLPPDEISIVSYDAIVIGTPLHYGSHDARISWFLKEHCAHLQSIPTAFFSVSLGIVSDRDANRSAVEELATEFLDKHRFHPDLRMCFAGALRYSKYDWFTKQMMHWIISKAGEETSMDQDYEYTDWDSVDAFAISFAQFVVDAGQGQPSPLPRPR